MCPFNEDSLLKLQFPQANRNVSNSETWIVCSLPWDQTLQNTESKNSFIYFCDIPKLLVLFFACCGLKYLKVQY